MSSGSISNSMAVRTSHGLSESHALCSKAIELSKLSFTFRLRKDFIE